MTNLMHKFLIHYYNPLHLHVSSNILLILFFFFNRRYNPWWVLACFTISFHNLLPLHFSLQFILLILRRSNCINPLNAELNPICYLLALLGAHHFLHVSRTRVKSLTLRLLMSYIYGAPILDVSRSHTTTHHSR